MTDLLIRVYRVRFGDAILVVVPDMNGGQEVKRHILFDFGNALGTEGGQDLVFEPVIDDIRSVLGGQPLDLYVMTHEHLDHVQGLFYAADRLHKTITCEQAWLTGSADPTYYDQPGHENAKKQKIAALAAFNMAAPRLRATPYRSPFSDVLLATNDTRSTAKCVDFLRTKLTKPGDVHYVDRTTDLSTLQPATSASLTLWAPEENTADYYGRFEALAASLRIGDNADLDSVAAGTDADGPDELELPTPPAGVDAGAFYNLIDIRHANLASTLLQIDKAANNTSVVLHLEWHGWRLLFPGDAEKRSWRTMDREGLIQPVHFLKVSHHGSHTGMPPTEILDKLLPLPAPDPRPRRAAVSTFPDTYEGVPDEGTLVELRRRTTLTSTMDLPAGQLFVDFTFSPA